jgi:PhnB protein
MNATTHHRIIQPYLFFNGRCEQAVEFYRKAIGAEVDMIMRYNESPEPAKPGMLPPGFENKIMHASFRVGETTIMASDGCSTENANFQGFSLSLSVATDAEADRAFAALADGGQVRMSLAKTFWSPRFGMVEDRFGIGWMVTVAPAVKPFVITRTFDASRDKVWKAWTERERLMQWFSPKGFTMTTAKLDLRPGGSLHYCLRSQDGKEMWGRFVYREIAAPGRIVLVNSFSDAKGGITRHPFSATWPLETLSTTTLAEEGGQTKLTIEWSPLNPTDEERKTFDTSHAGMTQGWTGTFDQLAAYLAKS